MITHESMWAAREASSPLPASEVSTPDARHPMHHLLGVARGGARDERPSAGGE